MKLFNSGVLIFLFFLGCQTGEVFVIEEKITQNKNKAVQAIDSLMRGYDYYERFSGSVLIAHRDSIWYQNSFGYSDFNSKIKNSDTSVYGIASCAKPFTATAILRLVQEGKLSLEDKLSGFYPELGPLSNKISIENLLTHSSGIAQDIGRGDNWDEIIFPKADAISSDSLIHFFGELNSRFSPGNKFDYNNHNYVLLAGIIEKVTGTDYRTHIRKTFSEPLQMDATDFNQVNIGTTRLSKPHTDLPNSFQPPPFWDDSWAVGAGGMYSSVNDLYIWLRKLNRREILSSELTDEMFRPIQADGKEHYGLGWQISNIHGNKYLYHDGGTNGYYCKIGFIPLQELYVIILSNHTHNLEELNLSSRLIGNINRQIMNILFEKKYTILPVPGKVIPFDFNKKVTINGHTFTIRSPRNENLIITSEGDYSVFDLPYLTALSEETERFRITETIVDAFGRHDFKTILDHSTFMMRILLSEDDFAEIWKDLAGETGALKSWNCYRLPDQERPNDYFVRMVYEKKEIGLQLVFSGQKINGMFTDKTFSFNGPTTVDCIALGKGQYFLDGFEYNYPDGTIIKVNENYFLNILNQSYKITF